MRSYPIYVPIRPEAHLRMVMVPGRPNYREIALAQLERVYPLVLAWLWLLAFAAIDAGRPWANFGIALVPGLVVGTALWLLLIIGRR